VLRTEADDLVNVFPGCAGVDGAANKVVTKKGKQVLRTKPKPTGKIVSDKSYLNDSKGDELARSANKKNMARTSLISPTV